MNPEAQIFLEKRLARYIAERLARTSPDEPPLLRTMAAYAAARVILLRAQSGNTPLEHIDSRLDYLEATNYEI